MALVRCRRCSTKLAQYVEQNGYAPELEIWEDGEGKKFVGGDDTTTVAIPFVLKYLDSELLAMGIKMTYNVSPR